MDDSGRVTGSKAAPEAPAGLRPSGYDPARINAVAKAIYESLFVDDWVGGDSAEAALYRQAAVAALNAAPTGTSPSALSRAYRMGGDARAMTLAAWLRTLVDWNIPLERAADMIEDRVYELEEE